MNKLPRTIWWDVDESTGRAGVYLIDQTRLPLQGDVLCCNTHEGVCLAIASMALRGAPALGIGAAFALAVWSENESEDDNVESYLASMEKIAEEVAAVRPTAVNLAWGAEQTCAYAREHATLPLGELKAGVVAFAQSLCADDEARCRAIGSNGAKLFEAFAGNSSDEGCVAGANVLTLCNAGSLATGYFGTALGIIYSTFEQGTLAQVWACETRPLNQGARLTTWELMMSSIPVALICDSAAASIMAKGWVDAVIVGADRICANGDVANKIGTYGLACLAKAHNIPFYVAAPNSTVDLACKAGADVTIEARDPREMEGFTASGIILPEDAQTSKAFDLLTEQGARDLKLKNGHQMTLARKGGGYSFDAWMRTTPEGVFAFNPAFDITPASLVTAIITEKGIFAPASIANSCKTDA